MNVAVVILNWNGKQLLEQFLPSVVEHSSQATIYVADNASTDDSVAFLKSQFPSVHIIQNTVNGGYARGYNEALSGLSEELFVLLNNDVEVTDGWLTPIVSEFKTNAQLHAAQPKILDYRKRDHFEYAGAAGGFLDKLGYPYCRGRIFDTIEKDQGQYNDSQEIFWASGACLFVRKDIFKAAGGFDEDLFAHQEEIDLCWRIRANGGMIKHIGKAAVYHLGGGSLNVGHPKKTYYNFRNTLLILFKNVQGSKAYWLVFLRLCLDAPAGIRFLLQGKPRHLWAVVRAHFGFYRLFPSYLQKRKKHASPVRYFRINSIVWRYYISKKRTFNSL